MQVKGIQRQTEDNIEDKYYYNQWVIPVLYFIILLLILYRILKSYKKFGVQKMLGYSIKDIWLKEELNLIISQCIIIFIVNIIMSIFCFSEFNIFFIRFIMKLLIMNIIQIVILFVVTSIPFIYLRNVTVQNVIKNKLPIKDIIIFNSVLKVLLIVLFFNLINQGIQNYDRINYVFSNKYKAWENANDYYIIPYLSSKQGEPPLDESDRATQLYFNLNKDGTIMADFNLFLPDQRETLKNDKQYDYERDWVTVNPNYLKENIIYDVNNEPVNISEEDTNLVLLVPDKYKKDEKGIIELWEKIKSGYLEDFIRHQNIKIIYTKSNQEIFSYQAAVNIDNGNMVKDPIVRVITEKNGVPFDYHITIGFTGYPIKIKVDPSFDAEKYIYNKLKEVGLEKYVDKIAPANDGVAFESKSVYELIIFIAGGIIMLMIAMIIVITQNIYCFFEQYKKQLAIRQFHGYRAIDKYKECYILIGITSLGAFIINACVGKMNINIQIILTFVFILIDLFMTTITIRCVGKRKIISVIKGS